MIRRSASTLSSSHAIGVAGSIRFDGDVAAFEACLGAGFPPNDVADAFEALLTPDWAALEGRIAGGGIGASSGA
jgi:hypothetical protein